MQKAIQPVVVLNTTTFIPISQRKFIVLYCFVLIITLFFCLFLVTCKGKVKIFGFIYFKTNILPLSKTNSIQKDEYGVSPIFVHYLMR
ncbi:hypothetical protein ABD76_03640 [Paenibacillus dendritiformis]|nr:hypothetical protein [Paenibacillus dendritiformis]